MSYRRQWFMEALARTRSEWAWGRVLVTAVFPALSVLGWVLFKGWVGWLTVWQTLCVAMLALVIVLVLSFTWHGLGAPGGLAERCAREFAEKEKTLQEETERLNAEIASLRKKPYTAEHERLVREIVSNVTEDDRKLLRYLLHHGETQQHRININGRSENDVNRAISACLRADLIVDRFEHVSPGVTSARYLKVKESFLDALKDVPSEPGPADL